MRRALLAWGIIAAAAAPAAAAPAESQPRASLESFACQRDANPLTRAIAVVGVMRPIAGTQRMEMRFVLQRREIGTESFTPVQGGDLGRWRDPKPTTLGQHPDDVWRLKKVVANLTGPATYRLRVTFRWRGAGDVVLDRTTLTSTACAEPQ